MTVADAFTAPLRSATAWVPCDGLVPEEKVADAIVRCHDLLDLRPCPSDSDHVDAKWEIPAGMAEHHDPNLPTADRLRVTMPTGDRYVLSIEREGGGGDDGTQECAYVQVIEAVVRGRIQRKRQKPEVRRG